MGGKAHRPDPATRRQVEAMCAYGMAEPIIAKLIGVDPKTLRKHYREELDTGQIKANTKVAENLYRKATGDGRESVIAAIFWLKTRAQWKETNVHELTGPPPRLNITWTPVPPMLEGEANPTPKGDR